MRRLLDIVIFIIIILTPYIRILNSYIGISGDVIQMLFLLLFLVRFLAKKNSIYLYFFHGIMLMGIFISALLYGFINDYIKLYIFCGIGTLAMDETFTESLKRFILDGKKWVIVSLVGINLLLVYYLNNASSFYNMYGIMYFKGSMNHPHTMAYTCAFVLMMTFVLAETYHNKWLLVLGIVPIYAINLTGVRSIVVAIVIGFLIYLLKRINSIMNLFWLIVGSGSFLLILVTFFSENPIVEKFLVTNDDISSGRFRFWMIDIKAWLDLNFLNKIFGYSFIHLYRVNFNYFRLVIGAHNDFITMLVGMGLLGLMLYLMLLTGLAVKLRLEYFVAFVILAGLNGLFGYTELVYVLPVVAVLNVDTVWKIDFLYGNRRVMEVGNEKNSIS